MQILCRSDTMDQAVLSVSLPLGLSMVLQSTAETSLLIFSVSLLQIYCFSSVMCAIITINSNSNILISLRSLLILLGTGKSLQTQNPVQDLLKLAERVTLNPWAASWNSKGEVFQKKEQVSPAVSMVDSFDKVGLIKWSS